MFTAQYAYPLKWSSVMTSMDASAYTAGGPYAQFPHDWEGQDVQLATAQEYLALLEADAATDELTIAIARHAVLQRKQTLARAVAGES
jgi:hypothetical protein